MKDSRLKYFARGARRPTIEIQTILSIKKLSNDGGIFRCNGCSEDQRLKAQILRPLLTVSKKPALKPSHNALQQSAYTVDKREKEYQGVRIQQFTESCNLLPLNPRLSKIERIAARTI